MGNEAFWHQGCWEQMQVPEGAVAVVALFWYHKYVFNEPILVIYLTEEDVPWLQILSLLSLHAIPWTIDASIGPTAWQPAGSIT